MNKLELAHEFMLAMVEAGCSDGPELLERAWQYADAMIAEKEKRQDKSRPEVLDDFDIDWSNIPEWANFFAIDKDGLQYIYAYQPYLVDERDYWADHFGSQDGHSEEVELIKNYTGNWKNSLRKRP